jgi:MSHA pilin protein MshA
VNVVNWYPQANLAGIVGAAGLTPTFPATDAALQAEGYQRVGGGAAIGSSVTIRVTGGPNPAQCFFTYRPSNAGGAAGSAALTGAVTPASVSGSTAGC